ncbi:MAG TPA: tryptophan synthase subunit alpha [Gemmatimonadaceae bacterium]|jgi:tryptophan synthase alpha chain|nr:tryptophan synthase subunit alpha [Gemmatimonadaceae bacterium]
MGSASAITSSDAFARRFALTAAERRAALVVYLTAGHPDLERSLELLRSLPDAGADIIEVGVPFSDPMADGPIIQASSQRALARGMTFEKTLRLIERARLGVPVVLFTYLNPLLAAGHSALDRAREAGCDGLLVTDLPVGADRELEERFGRGPLAFVRLVAPTTPAERMAEIATHGGGFVYLISRLGVTGVRDDLPAALPSTIRTLRAATALPICVGFGISTAAQAGAVASLADGVVVGSAVVRAAEQGPAAALRLVSELRAALAR